MTVKLNWETKTISSKKLHESCIRDSVTKLIVIHMQHFTCNLCYSSTSGCSYDSGPTKLDAVLSTQGENNIVEEPYLMWAKRRKRELEWIVTRHIIAEAMQFGLQPIWLKGYTFTCPLRMCSDKGCTPFIFIFNRYSQNKSYVLKKSTKNQKQLQAIYLWGKKTFQTEIISLHVS